VWPVLLLVFIALAWAGYYVALVACWTLAQASIPLAVIWFWGALRRREQLVVTLPDARLFDWSEEREKLVAEMNRAEESRSRICALYTQGDDAGIQRTKATGNCFFDERKSEGKNLNQELSVLMLRRDDQKQRCDELKALALGRIPDLSPINESVACARSEKINKVACYWSLISFLITAWVLFQFEIEFFEIVTAKTIALLPVVTPFKDHVTEFAASSLFALMVFHIVKLFLRKQRDKAFELPGTEDWQALKNHIRAFSQV
jgi:hypothetical protein